MRMNKKKKRVDITKSFDDPESIKISNKIFQIGGRLKEKDFTQRFTI